MSPRSGRKRFNKVAAFYEFVDPKKPAGREEDENQKRGAIDRMYTARFRTLRGLASQFVALSWGLRPRLYAVVRYADL